MFKYFSIGKYYHYLFPYLKKRYGRFDEFSSGQIKKTVEECNFNKKHIPYAYALYLNERNLNEVLSEEYPKLSPDTLRKYIAKRFFNNNNNYNFKEHVLSAVGNSRHGCKDSGISAAGTSDTGSD